MLGLSSAIKSHLSTYETDKELGSRQVTATGQLEAWPDHACPEARQLVGLGSELQS